MKIYHFSLALFVFIGFTSVISSIGVFDNVYTHTNEVSVTVNESDVEGIKQISGDNILSADEYASSNPDQGGVSSFIPGYSLLIKTLDSALNVDKLIMEYCPLSATSTVQPFADYAKDVMWVIYGAGLISYLRKYQVG